MSFYPVKFKKGERINEYELFDCLSETPDILTFIARDVNSNMRINLEIPVSEKGASEINAKRHVLQKTADIPYLRKLVSQKAYDASGNLLALEMLPPENLRQHVANKGRFKIEKLREILCEILSLADKLQKRNIELPAISLDNVYLSASKVVIDYKTSAKYTEFIESFGKIIAVIADDEKLAELLIYQLPIEQHEIDFNHVKARMISIIGGKAENENFSLDTNTVKCPGCNTEYVLSANFCKKCNINLLTGLKVDACKYKKHKKQGSSGYISAIVILCALISIFAVFSKVLGISWMLWTVITGIAFAFLVIMFIVFMGS